MLVLVNMPDFFIFLSLFSLKNAQIGGFNYVLLALTIICLSKQFKFVK